MWNIWKSRRIYALLRGVLYLDTMDFSPVVFDVFLHGASNEIIKKNKKNQEQTKKDEKPPKTALFACFSLFSRLFEILLKNGSNDFFHTPWRWSAPYRLPTVVCVISGKILVFLQFSCKDAKIGSFLVFFDILKFILEPPCSRKSLTNYWFWSVTSSRVEMKIEHGSSKPLLLLKKWHFVNYSSKNGVFWCFWAFWRSNLRKRSQDLATIY